MAPIQNHPALEDAVASLSIKNVADETLRRLRARADRNHRSLQQELLAIVEAAAFADSELTVDDLAEFVDDLGLSTSADMTDWIRELRDAG
jgi:antitoxin FitA